MDGSIDKFPLPNSQKLLQLDDSHLRDLFLKVLHKQDKFLATKVDEIYELAKFWCDDASGNHFDKLATAIQNLGPLDRVLVRSGSVDCEG